MEHYILALDQGTTSCRAVIVDKAGTITNKTQKEFTQLFPQTGWVEHDPNEIWSTQLAMIHQVLDKSNLSGSQIAAFGITNQRETIVVWEKETGKPIYNAIVWQDKRTAAFCEELKEKGLAEKIRAKTGLVIDAYFSGTKVKWVLDNVPGAREKAEKGELLFGTIDTWLIWKLTNGGLHITDVSNASRSLFFNINSMSWDEELLSLLTIPKSMLPKVCESSSVYGYTDENLFGSKIPIAGIAGDQQAALFGQMCTQKGMVKNTYGTGCFMLMNIGDTPVVSKNNLLTTVAWKINGKTTYALEGSIFIAGAVVQWLRDSLKIIETSSDIETLANSVADSGGLVFVPTFAGLGAPYWNQDAKGTLFGLTRGSTDAHIARAALEAIAYQTMDVLHAMETDSGVKIKELRVDGGGTINKLLMQFQADVLNTSTIRPKNTETTVMGAAYLAGLAVGYWKDAAEIQTIWESDVHFEPSTAQELITSGIKEWHKAVDTVQYWSKN